MIQRDLKSGPQLLNGACVNAISAARRGSSVDLGTLLEQFRAELLELADAELGSTIGPKASASDIVQEALLDAVADFSQFEGTTGDELRAWLRRIVRNRSVDISRRYRQADKRDVARELPLDEGVQNELAVPELSPSAQVAQNDMARQMLVAVDRLPEPHRTILQLRHREGRTFAEIGRQQHCTAFRARRAWYEALLLLQRELKEHA